MLSVVKLRILALFVLCLLVTALLAQDLPDTHTPENFLFDRQSRIVGEYVEAVLKRGDAATLIDPVANVHRKLREGSYSAAERDAIKENLASLIGIAEGLIHSQNYPDRVPGDDYELFTARQIERFEELGQELEELEPGSTANIQIQEIVLPPEQRVFNELKKDLLEEAYAMLDTMDAL